MLMNTFRGLQFNVSGSRRRPFGPKVWAAVPESWSRGCERRRDQEFQCKERRML